MHTNHLDNLDVKVSSEIDTENISFFQSHLSFYQLATSIKLAVTFSKVETSGSRYMKNHWAF